MNSTEPQHSVIQRNRLQQSHEQRRPRTTDTAPSRRFGFESGAAADSAGTGDSDRATTVGRMAVHWPAPARAPAAHPPGAHSLPADVPEYVFRSVLRRIRQTKSWRQTGPLWNDARRVVGRVP